MKNPSTLKRNAFILTVLVCFFALINFAHGADCDPNTPAYCNPLNLSGGKGVQSFGDVLVIAIKFLLSFIGVIALFFMVYAGAKYATSIGDDKRTTEAKNTLTAAVTGLVLAAVSYGVVKALEKILTVK